MLTFELKKIGLIDSAKVKLNDLTILTGLNSTGKTYVTYSIHGFLRWLSNESYEFAHLIPKVQFAEKTGQFDLIQLQESYQKALPELAIAYQKRIPKVLAMSSPLTPDAEFRVVFEQNGARSSDEAIRDIESARRFNLFGENGASLFVQKSKGSATVNVLLVESEGTKDLPDVSFFVSDIAMKLFLKNSVWPESFIASSERTGAAIFRQELDFSRSRQVRELQDRSFKEFGPAFVLPESDSRYPSPVNENVDFIRALDSIHKQKSRVLEEHSDIEDLLEEMTGGRFVVDSSTGVKFVPSISPNQNLHLAESSSTVRALVILSFWIRCEAEPGDLLIIDEPELNLHPKNQRLMARLIARLVNAGVKVFITTHSDYIVRELNTLIMLKSESNHERDLAELSEYRENEYLDHNRVSAYQTTHSSKSKKAKHPYKVVPLEVDREGIIGEAFDREIHALNEAQDTIRFGV